MATNKKITYRCGAYFTHTHPTPCRPTPVARATASRLEYRPITPREARMDHRPPVQRWACRYQAMRLTFLCFVTYRKLVRTLRTRRCLGHGPCIHWTIDHLHGTITHCSHPFEHHFAYMSWVFFCCCCCIHHQHPLQVLSIVRLRLHMRVCWVEKISVGQTCLRGLSSVFSKRDCNM